MKHIFFFFSALVFSPLALAGSQADLFGGVSVFAVIALMLILARVGSLTEQVGQPAVLGELLFGILLGNLALLGLPTFNHFTQLPVFLFLAELGVIILLFQVGLETELHALKRVGGQALLVALVGIIAPFVLGAYVIGPWLLADTDWKTHLFLGATLSATSVGITGRVFKDMQAIHLKEAQIVLGAAVIDDVLGLVILAVVSAIVTTGQMDIMYAGWTLGKAILFLVAALFIGRLATPHISNLFAKIHPGAATQFTVMIGLALFLAYLSQLVGLAPIIGAFAAGLILEAHYFERYTFKDKELHHFIEPLGFFVIPLFFIMTGMQVDLTLLFDPKIIGTALIISVIAIFGKLLSGFVCANGIDKWIVGFGMVPRGEVGLIFASIGKSLGVVSDSLFSVIIVTVIITTLITPPVLVFFIKKRLQQTI